MEILGLIAGVCAVLFNKPHAQGAIAWQEAINMPNNFSLRTMRIGYILVGLFFIIVATTKIFGL